MISKKKRARETVSYNMSRIRSSGSEMEHTLGHAMFSLGLRYRKQYKIMGRPDFAFPKQKVAIFADSDFWHGRNWDKTKTDIKTNREFWIRKIERNIERDKEVNVALAIEGWRVIRFWEDDIKKNPVGCAMMVKEAVESRRKRSPTSGN
jgi:DNA mismatch endonuclease Vsr